VAKSAGVVDPTGKRSVTPLGVPVGLVATVTFRVVT
jgi:hypothetical protein